MLFLYKNQRKYYEKPTKNTNSIDKTDDTKYNTK